MSLVPTFVLAVDGKWYKDPMFYGPDWFVCFDDEDDPEIVVQVCQDERRRAEHRLAGAGIYHGNLRRGHKSSRLFPPYVENRNDFRVAVSFFFNIEKPIPIPNVHYSRFDARPDAEGVFCEGM